ncbi:Phosphoryl transfer system, HPr [gamma proteobacterium HdN1]|nr:Phosphoryl transfer system, HPr [gamma proteobacterium HdN1]
MTTQGKTQITIINKLGLHARAASKLVAMANRYESRIILFKGAQQADAKNIMAVLLLAASKNTTLEITADGRDWEKALEEITALINNRFGEAE